MKKLIFATILIVAIIGTVSSQDKKMWIGGTIALSNQKVGDLSDNQFSFVPEFGYNINEKFAVGAGIGFSVNSDKNLAGDKQSFTTFLIRPFARYSFITLGNAQIFAQGELPIAFYGGENYDGSSKDGYNSISLIARPGIAYFFNESWGAQLLMPSVFNFTTSSNSTSSFKFGINDGYTIQGYLLSSQIGFFYRF